MGQMLEEKPVGDAQLLSKSEVARLLGLSTDTLAMWRMVGKGPKFLKLGHKRNSPIRYRRADVLAWVSEQSAVGPREAA